MTYKRLAFFSVSQIVFRSFSDIQSRDLLRNFFYAESQRHLGSREGNRKRIRVRHISLYSRGNARNTKYERLFLPRSFSTGVDQSRRLIFLNSPF